MKDVSCIEGTNCPYSSIAFKYIANQSMKPSCRAKATAFLRRIKHIACLRQFSCALKPMALIRPSRYLQPSNISKVSPDD